MLEEVIKRGASDLHITVGVPPVLRINGVLQRLEMPKLTSNDTREMVYSILTARQRETLETNLEFDLSYSVPGSARFRVNAYFQRNSVGAAFRIIPYRIKTIEELMLPLVVKEFARLPRGFILVTGPTGQGKSTTLAAIMDLINSTREEHIITIEDPIEILHIDKKCIIHQREIGTDTDSYREALRHVTRQDPDVILIGEMRDVETVTSAMNIAMTGHLVLSTFHTQDTTETVNRMIDFFPPTQQKQVRITMTSTLGGVVSQLLLPRCDGGGRVPAIEIMVMNGRLAECLLNEEPTSVMREIIADGEFYGMQTFNQSLVSLYADGLVDFQTAMKASNQPHDFILMAKQMGLPVEETLAIR